MKLIYYNKIKSCNLKKVILPISNLEMRKLINGLYQGSTHRPLVRNFWGFFGPADRTAPPGHRTNRLWCVDPWFVCSKTYYL